MKKIITIAFLLSSFGVMAQSLTFTSKAPQPLISLIGIKITSQDTSYSIYSDLPMRSITYKYAVDKKQVQLVKKDLYDVKNWMFYSFLVEPFSGFAFNWTGYQMLTTPNFKLAY